jgi:hypothetical protein
MSDSSMGLDIGDFTAVSILALNTVHVLKNLIKGL